MSSVTPPPPPARVEYDNRLILRPVEPSDVPQIEKARNLSLPDLQVYMEWSHFLTDRAQFLQRVLTQWAHYFRGDEYEMALFDKKTGDFLVYSGFYPSLRLNPRCFEIGYWTASAHKGKGFATLATQLQIALIFEYFKGDRIEITCSTHNKASIRVIEKCGFQQEGILRNFYPKGTEQMHAAGYIRDRRVALFSLIPEDLPRLAWYPPLIEKMVLYPLLDPPMNVRGYGV